MIKGNLLKMHSKLDDKDQVIYHLSLNDNKICMNDYLEKKIKIESCHEINCIKCGRMTKTSFAQGYCFPCFKSAPETEECVLRPELCRAHEGKSRDMTYAETHCLIEHFVYLAYTGGLKVGVTRHTQIPTRWIDQGATKAIKLFSTPNRYLAGLIEVALKASHNDKTNWRKMLCLTDESDVDLIKQKDEILSIIESNLKEYSIDNDNYIQQIKYPLTQIPVKVKSINLDKNPEVKGTLTGIKGQYLIFDNGIVFNIRRHNGYKINLYL